MGQRANLIIVENSDYAMYYSHWCANTITRDLFWGPDFAMRFVCAQRPVEKTDWLDDVWAEGGAVIDVDKQVLLIYGGEDVMYDVPLRRVYMDMLARVWDSWEVRWAHEGIAEMADYVGYPRANVLSDREPDVIEKLHLASLADEDAWIEVLGSCRIADGTLCLYPLRGMIAGYAAAGPRLAKACSVTRGWSSLSADDWGTHSFPDGGFHIDWGRHRFEFWSAADLPGILDVARSRWEDWTVVWHKDRFEEQLALTDERLQFPMRSIERLQEGLVSMLLQEYGRSPAESVLEVFAQDLNVTSVEINPFALRDDRLEIPLAIRRAIVAKSLGYDRAN
ncbi:MAG: hypothetical protein GC159_16600 [Phycisphaera sp.]|nr:hypothetical protein [Phycisphaera sp.]